MRYFELIEDVERDGRWFLGAMTVDGESIDARVFTYARPYNREGRLRCSVERSGERLDFTYGSFRSPIVTPRLMSELSDLASDNVQFLPIAIDGAGDYYVANVVRGVDCVDEARSRFTKFDATSARPDRVGEYEIITKLVIDRLRAAHGGNIFGIKRWHPALVVSEPIVDLFVRNEWTGVRIEPVSQ